ncbi:MAG: type II toxin-antitoxin system prevent-host-death family antitoxin [Deltaproteobacteria bacterium]|nr:type II toxin-antitoxin system prevent-host-death family antitoxin [Deltaproteobacteria bacterium]
MKSSWTLQDAKNKFSQVVNNALLDGPQYVTRRGVEAVVVVSVQEYETLTSHKPSFTDFLLQCPKLDGENLFERRKEYPRELDL